MRSGRCTCGRRSPRPAGSSRPRRALTAADIRSAQQAAAAAGLSVETRNSIPSLSTIVNDATVFGIVLALAILGMSVGLVRSEAGRDLRTLAATGASGTTRCIIVATTAGALGFTGALIGAAGGYLAAIGFARSNQLDAWPRWPASRS